MKYLVLQSHTAHYVLFASDASLWWLKYRYQEVFRNFLAVWQWFYVCLLNLINWDLYVFYRFFLFVLFCILESISLWWIGNRRKNKLIHHVVWEALLKCFSQSGFCWLQPSSIILAYSSVFCISYNLVSEYRSSIRFWFFGGWWGKIASDSGSSIWKVQNICFLWDISSSWCLKLWCIYSLGIAKQWYFNFKFLHVWARIFFWKEKLLIYCLVTQWYSLCEKDMINIWCFLFTDFSQNEMFHWDPPAVKLFKCSFEVMNFKCLIL